MDQKPAGESVLKFKQSEAGMNFRKLFDLRGTKVGYLIFSAVTFLIFVVLFFSGVDWLTARYGEQMGGMDTTLMLGVFIGSAMIGMLVTHIANDGRGHTYAVYGGLLGLIAIAILMRTSPLLAALVGLMAPIGGFNGATLGESLRRAKNVRRK